MLRRVSYLDRQTKRCLVGLEAKAVLPRGEVIDFDEKAVRREVDFRSKLLIHKTSTVSVHQAPAISSKWRTLLPDSLLSGPTTRFLVISRR